MEKAKVIRLVDDVDYTSNGIISKQIIKNKSGNITLFAFDADQGLSEHTAPFDALVQVIDGEVQISIDKKTYGLTSGDSIILPAGIPHAVQAKTRFKMLLTMVKE